MDGRVLFISGSIGLGHAGRDLAIANALRSLAPGLDVEWLAAEPARSRLLEAGELVLPEAAALADESALAEAASSGFGLDIPRYLLRARRGWHRNVATFRALTAARAYDLTIGDETYEIALALAERPRQARPPFVMLYDFVGLDAISRSPVERLSVYLWNRTWCGGRHGRPPAADLALFLGELEDVPDRPFGPRLANRREYARRYYRCVGYVLGFDPDVYADRTALRTRLGYDQRPLVVCAVGGTAIGGELLQLCADAHPELERRIGDVQMLLVCGPRIDLDRIHAPADVVIAGYVPRLFEHLAAADVAVVQGGGTTTLELTALRRPFAYFPLAGHFEQQISVTNRLVRHRAGRRLEYAQTTPRDLADVVVELLDRPVEWPAVDADGAHRAGELILQLLRERLT